MNWQDLREWQEWVIAGNRLDQWVVALVLLLVGFPLLKRTFGWLTHRARHLVGRSDRLGNEIVGKLSSRVKPIFVLSLSVYLTTYFAGLVLPLILARAVRVFVIFGASIQAASFGFGLVELFFNAQHRKRFGFGDANAAVVGLLQLCCKIVLLIIVFLTGLEMVGVNVTTLVAGLGVGGIAVALAVQNVLGDLLASLAIVLDKPFEVGDFIVVGNYKGTIEKVGLKTTRIRALSGEQLVYSNSELLKSQIQNYKRMTERRVEFTVGVVYGLNENQIKKIPEIIESLVRADSSLRFERSHLSALAASSLDFETVYWVKDPEFSVYRASHQALLLGMISQFKTQAIEFAFPTQTIIMSATERTSP